MSAISADLIPPRSLNMLGCEHGHASSIYVFDDTAAQYSDLALLEYCDWSDYLGGRVEREANRVRVHVYTD